jgi:hypothetical protein
MYKQIYDFAASAGALEGYAYEKKAMSEAVIAKWCDNLVTAYNRIPPEVREQFQSSCDGTLGRAIHSLTPLMGENHETIGKLRSLIAGQMPASADDFQKDKSF